MTPEAAVPAAPPPRSPGGIFLGRLVRNRAAMTGGAVLAVLYGLAVFGSFVSPYDPGASDPDHPDHPPARIRFVDASGRFHWRPFIHGSRLTNVLRRTYEEDRSVRYPVRFLVKGEPYKLWWLFPAERRLFGLGDAEPEAGASPPSGAAPPAPDGIPLEEGEMLEEGEVLGEGEAGEAGAAVKPKLYLFGSDRLGRDIFSRVLSGAKISLSIGLIGIVVTMVLGLAFGGISGYAGGIADSIIMRFVELLMSIPGLYLILALRAALSDSNPLLETLFGLKEGEPLGSGRMYVLMVAILGLVSWGGTARVIRGMVLALRELDYVQAARAMGASHARIIALHLLPNTFTYVVVSATLSIPFYILGEVSLSFLGAGIEEPQASWGNMLYEAQNLSSLVNHPWLLIPGVFIFLTVFAFNFLGDGVRDALDPRHLR